MSFTPTAEQDHVVDEARAGHSLAVVAGAGTGKTATLALLAAALPGRRGRYLAFNRAVVDDSARRFGDHIISSTAHSLAYQHAGRAFRRRLDSPRLPSTAIAERLHLDAMVVSYGGERKLLTAGYLAGVTMTAVKNFAHSADDQPDQHHVAYIDGIDLPVGPGRRGWANNRAVRAWIQPAMRRAWADLCDPNGTLTYSHDFYLKAYQLARPTIDADLFLVDEAQDLSPVLADIVGRQSDCQTILVGDPYQSIYGWLGAVDAMNTITVDRRCYLTQSFRFGDTIAAVANNLLARLGADLRLHGHPAVASSVGADPTPTAILTRSNAGALKQLLRQLDDARRVALVGGSRQLSQFCQAAIDLEDGGRTAHRELACFTSWPQVVDYVDNDEQGGELRLLVQLIDRFGAPKLLAALTHTRPEAHAEVTISTATKPKAGNGTASRSATTTPPPNPAATTPTPKNSASSTSPPPEPDATSTPTASPTPPADPPPPTRRRRSTATGRQQPKTTTEPDQTRSQTQARPAVPRPTRREAAGR